MMMMNKKKEKKKRLKKEKTTMMTTYRQEENVKEKDESQDKDKYLDDRESNYSLPRIEPFFFSQEH